MIDYRYQVPRNEMVVPSGGLKRSFTCCVLERRCKGSPDLPAHMEGKKARE